MIQEIGENKFDIAFREINPGEEDRFFLVRDGKLLLHREAGRLMLPRVKSLEEKDRARLVFAFCINHEAYFMLPGETICDRFDENFEYAGLRTLYGMKPEWLALAGVTCNHLNHWYMEHQYCGCCKGRMEHSRRERALICSECGNIQYPRISPVVMAAVTDGERLLVTRYAGREYKGLALIAGFAEIGETLEAALRREVEEETGVHVKNLQYFGSQPWGYSDSLISGFFAELDGSDQIRIDRDELSEAVWLSREEIPKQSDQVSITSAMMEAFRTGQAGVKKEEKE